MLSHSPALCPGAHFKALAAHGSPAPQQVPHAALLTSAAHGSPSAARRSGWDELQDLLGRPSPRGSGCTDAVHVATKEASRHSTVVRAQIETSSLETPLRTLLGRTMCLFLATTQEAAGRHLYFVVKNKKPTKNF